VKRALLGLVAVVAALAAGLGFNLSRLPPPHVPGASPAALDVDAEAAAQRLAQAVRIPTISHAERAQIDPAPFAEFAEFLRVSFPRVHAQLQRTAIGPSLLFHWRGSDTQAAPVLLLAHMDVVPVEPGTEALWQQPPFSGARADGFIWGRGTLDDKGSLMAQLEAIEALLSQGHQPQRSLYLALGHDEEIGGAEGARKIAAQLRAAGLRFAFALDEGGAITEGIVSGVQPPVANIMIAEKGYVSLRLRTRDTGGHSSRPPPQTAVGRLARAVARVQDSPFPARLTPPVADMLLRIAPEMPLAGRLAIANLWLFRDRVLASLARNPTTDAMIRTSTAPTLFHAGIKDNVLPSEAQAVINFRILPGDSLQSVQEHVRRVVADDGVEIALDGEFGDEPSPISSTDSESFRLIERVVREQYPEAVIATGLVIGATDLRHYAGLYGQRFNFTPFRVRADDLNRIHGHNERIGAADYVRGIGFYARLIEAATR
jgi:carboxypeptidase PM20D1